MCIRDRVSTWDEPVCIAVLPDHPTPVEIRTHVKEPVPFIIYYPEMCIRDRAEFLQRFRSHLLHLRSLWRISHGYAPFQLAVDDGLDDAILFQDTDGMIDGPVSYTNLLPHTLRWQCPQSAQLDLMATRCV